jgi:hypothetical protein
MTGMRRPVRLPQRLLGGHLGASVSALVDGQLDAESSERAWDHVLHCLPCRRLVEHEGWVKRQLAQIAGTTAPDEPSDRLVGSLLHMDPTAASAWADVEDIEQRSRGRRRAGIALVGAGSVSAAVLGISTLGVIGGTTGTPATSIGRSSVSSTPSRAVVAPAVTIQGRPRSGSLGYDDNGAAHARSAANRP